MTHTVAESIRDIGTLLYSRSVTQLLCGSAPSPIGTEPPSELLRRRRDLKHVNCTWRITNSQ